MPSVLFVCTGNLYRSPMAAAMFSAMLLLEPVWVGYWRVESAGTWAQANQPAPMEVLQVMAKRGLDLKTHRSRVVSAEILGQFDLILTMERGQKEALGIEFPQYAGRVYMLSEMAGTRVSINDPIDRSVAGVNEVARELEDWLKMGKHSIIELASKG
jgi:protein-tyrosine-phosphatase